MPAGGGITLAAEGAGLLLGGVETALGIGEEAKAKKELARLKTPFKKVQDEYLQNKNIAEQIAGGGLPSATKDFLTLQADKGLSTSIKGILESGGSPNDIAKLFDVYDNSLLKTGAEDAELRLKNIEYFNQLNADVAGQKDIQFGVNELQPYEAKLKELTERRAAGQQNAFNGAQTAIGSLSALGTSMQNQSLLKSEKGLAQAQVDMFNRVFNTGGMTGGISKDTAGITLPTTIDPSKSTLSNPDLANSPINKAMFEKWLGSLPPEERSQYLNSYYGK